MRRRRLVALVALFVLIAPVALSAQSVADSSPFRALPLPAPNGYRASDGRPGPDYWQQRVDYDIQATLDVERQVLSGRETIRYTNNSPLPLPYLWFFLDQNICAPSSVTNRLNQPPLRFQETAFDFSCLGFPGGMTVEAVRLGGRELTREVLGTTMRVDLPAPLAPGASATLEVAWRFPIPEYGAGRMAREGTLYEMAWWYPRVAVYDDVRGWNHDPYIGAGEFYLEYGRFAVALTLPARFVVAATGVLQNPEQVLTAAQRERLAAARRADTAVAVIGANEAGRPVTRPAAGGTLTWRFAADSVRDFAFAAAPDFRWDATGWDGILIQTFYRPRAPMWEESIRMARHTIRHFSERLYRYPYDHATVIEGPIAGMEYPMLVFVAGTSRENLHFTLMHELGHQWYPMVVGSNERLYPWMDEGFNTFIDIEASEDYFRGTAYGDSAGRMQLGIYPQHAVPGQEQPLSTRPVESRDLFWTAYQKPALMLNLLRYEVLGKEPFDRAFRAYTAAWAFKHPTAADFFRMMRNETGVDLDWFWRGWIYTTARLDQAVDSVTTGPDSSAVHLSNRGAMVMPAELSLTFAGGRTETAALPVDMWNLGSRFTYRMRTGGRLTAVVVDPRSVMPDVDRSNNKWPK
ncbi:MAG TPA: M1 family metallopeptidase [Gemmatimonadales bacterium]|nr:M1 family metallopeptidase [Gemmatimonadales bacterium]